MLCFNFVFKQKLQQETIFRDAISQNAEPCIEIHKLFSLNGHQCQARHASFQCHGGSYTFFFGPQTTVSRN